MDLFNCHNFGFSCIDPGYPTDCEVNNNCEFKSQKERQEFEDLPNKFYFKMGDNYIQYFKNEVQLRFCLTDLPHGEIEKYSTDWGVVAVDGVLVSCKKLRYT
jgi:hypothetical protein